MLLVMHVDVSGLQVDPLTGLPNRGMFDAQLDLAVSLARDLGRRTGVMIVDMNKLKLINDVHGHRIGDEALRALAAELKQMAGPDCVVCENWGRRIRGCPSLQLRCAVCAAYRYPFRIRHRLLDRVGTQSHIRFCKRRNGALSRRRRDRQRTARFRRQVHVCAQVPHSGRLATAHQRYYEPLRPSPDATGPAAPAHRV